MAVLRKNFRYYLALARIIFWREFNTMYRRTKLGPLWALFAPAAYLVVFIFFRLMFGLKNPEGFPMIPFLFAGLTLWFLFANIVNSIFPALRSNIKILKKIPVSPLVFVFSAALLPLLTCGVYMVLLEGILIFYGYPPTIHHLAIPFIVMAVMAFAMGFGILVAAIGFYRQDIIQLLPTIIQLGMFATPIFFSAAIVPEQLRWVVDYNPIAVCVGMFRDVIFRATWPTPGALLQTLLVVAALWALALPFFKRTAKYIADEF